MPQDYDPEVVNTIISVGQQRGLGAREITAALATGLVESGLKNLPYGPGSSLGVFQQKPTQGWGTPDQIMDVEYAVNKFYDSIEQFDAEGISGAELAARIQRPGPEHSGRYAQRWGEAASLLSEQGDIGQADPMQVGPAQTGQEPQPFQGSQIVARMLAMFSDEVAGRDPSQRMAVGGSLGGRTGEGAARAGQAIMAQQAARQQPEPIQPQGMDVQAAGTEITAAPEPTEGGLNPQFEQSLQRLMADAPGTVTITSGFRSVQRQQELWNQALEKYGDPEVADNWVARPGSSKHNHGLAADLNYENDQVRQWVHENAEQYGIHFPLSNENWHAEPLGSR